MAPWHQFASFLHRVHKFRSTWKSYCCMPRQWRQALLQDPERLYISADSTSFGAEPLWHLGKRLNQRHDFFQSHSGEERRFVAYPACSLCQLSSVYYVVWGRTRNMIASTSSSGAFKQINIKCWQWKVKVPLTFSLAMYRPPSHFVKEFLLCLLFDN